MATDSNANRESMKVSEQKLRCQTCEKEFIPIVYKYGTNSEYTDKDFCSEKCREISQDNKMYQELVIARAMQVESLKNVIPQKYRETQTDKTDLIEKHIDDSLFIYGSAGVGKSVFAANLAMGIVDKIKSPIYWINYTSYLFDLKSMFNSKDKGDPYEEVKQLAKQDILFIDDFGTEKMTEFVQEITYYLINEREANEKRTIITSNLCLDEIEGRISSRISGMCKVLKFTGRDRRLK